ncbi:hypothetical protein BJX76DRAFT_339288 [Aspergillus varians]
MFHQQHYLYLLRRAYYTKPDADADADTVEDLQRFDFGRNRSVHVVPCFDYLVQSLVCSVDSTFEPAVDKEHGFWGAGLRDDVGILRR